MPLEQLPEELLLQVALYLPDSGTPKHLKNLSLTSRKLRHIAQEALFTTARLAITCGCHPKVNAVVKLLRTLLDRPDLASKIKILRFRAVRKRVDRLYAEQGFELPRFRDQCTSKLKELGYQLTHPWWRSIDNSVESAFGGLLLALLPNLADLDFWIKDHQRGPPSSECISGLWGGTTPPDAILYGWRKISHLVTGDTSMLKCGIKFDNLTALDLRTVSIGTVLRLNGPGSLQGAENIKDLALTVSIQFADQPLVEKAEITFSELFGALACRALKNLKILFINDGYHIGDDLSTELNTGYFLEQLSSVQKTLETLSITLETTEEDGELDWLVDMCQHPTKSLKDFTALKSLIVPQPFVFNGQTASWNTEDNCQPKNLPPKLEQLELLFPHECVEDWVQGFLAENYHDKLAETSAQTSIAEGPTFKKLTLTCREDVGNGIGASYFTDTVDEIWWNLSADYGIETEVYDQQRGTRQNLASLYEDQGLKEEDSDIDEDDVDEGCWEDEDDQARASPRRGPPEARQCISQEVTDQSVVLAYLKGLATLSTLSVGPTVGELAESLNLDVQRVADAVTVLRNDGNVQYSSGFGEGLRLQFVKDNGVLAAGVADEGGSQDEDDDRSHQRDQTKLRDSMSDPAGAHSVAILRVLRNLSSPSDMGGLTESEINTRLNMDPELAADTILDLLDRGYIRYYDNPDGSRRLFLAMEGNELLKGNGIKQMKADNALIGDDDDWEDDNGTDEDMPELEAFDPVPGPSMGPNVAPHSRVGLITPTAVLRCVRQVEPSQGLTHAEIAAQLGTHYGEILYRAHTLLEGGYVRDDGDRVYFVRENVELLAEDRNQTDGRSWLS